MLKREVLNKLLLLKLIQSSHLLTREKLSFLVFIIEKEGRKEKRQTFNYEFKRSGYGAYSNELEKDVEQLLLDNHIRWDVVLEITKKGREMLFDFEQAFDPSTNSFIKYYLFLYGRSSIFELSNTIIEKYDVATVPVKNVLLSVMEVDTVDAVKTKVAEIKRQLSVLDEEFEKNERMPAKKMKLILGERK